MSCGIVCPGLGVWFVSADTTLTTLPSQKRGPLAYLPGEMLSLQPIVETKNQSCLWSSTCVPWHAKLTHITKSISKSLSLIEFLCHSEELSGIWDFQNYCFFIISTSLVRKLGGWLAGWLAVWFHEVFTSWGGSVTALCFLYALLTYWLLNSILIKTFGNNEENVHKKLFLQNWVNPKTSRLTHLTANLCGFYKECSAFAIFETCLKSCFCTVKF